ncbi:MAG: Gfo/Idh/MocA family oxidoreductase [Actinomycetota bacterium]|jgi:predicted dehydrogenase|nr:Gfo/Idh/MocA family oxidoreductase [Actinomycetota bacterium]
MTKPARIGFIGAGWWATVNNIPQIAAREDAIVAAVCGLDPAVLEALRERYGVGLVTDDVDRLLSADLDGVVVSSPHHLHYEHARAALRRGCHVLCEKPMTLRASEAWELVALAREGERHLVVGYGWNYKPPIRAARQLMSEGAVGEIRYVLCHMASPTLSLFAAQEGGPPTEWEPTLASPQPQTWQDPARGGGYAHGQITHSSAALFRLTRLRAAEVMARSGTGPAAVDLYDAAVVTFDSGALGAFSGAGSLPDDDPFQVDLRIFGDEGVLLLDLERERLEIRRHDGAHRTVPLEPGSGRYSAEGPPNGFVELIHGRGENQSSGEVAARSVELIEALVNSAAAGGKTVTIDRSLGGTG